MEKLIELLNEAKPLKKYKEYWYSGNEIILITYAEDYGASKSINITLDVISKSYGFIEWLVENDKIDKDKLYNSEYKPYFWNRKTNAFSGFWAENILLMLLSISDTPIEDLISYLK